MSVINLIWAQSRNGAIGHKGALPWHLPEDLKRFKALTLGDTVIMGRKTWDSLPPSQRPLPGRRNIIITRQDDYVVPAGAIRARDLYEALTHVANHEIAWVIGGKQIYDLALPMATGLYVTELKSDYVGDTHAPQINLDHWVLAASMTDMVAAKQLLMFDYHIYKRNHHVPDSIECGE